MFDFISMSLDSLNIEFLLHIFVDVSLIYYFSRALNLCPDNTIGETLLYNLQISWLQNV